MKYNEQMENLVRRGLFRTDRSNKVDLVEGETTKEKEIENNNVPDGGGVVKELSSIENGTTGPPANYQVGSIFGFLKQFCFFFVYNLKEKFYYF